MPDEVAYNGRILSVNLTTGEIDVEELPEEMYRQHLGGYGLGARLLFDRIPADADPMGPDNILGFFPGLLTGTPLFGQRFQVVCKSPKNGGWGDANCGGDFGPMLKFTGYDGILFFGESEKPVYLYIDEETVELRDAEPYWGMLAIDCEDRFKEELGKKISVALIGPAGENLSFMAGVANERGRLAARSGVGAVMGSKRLKAVVAKPTRKILAQDKDVLKTVRASLDEFSEASKRFFTTFGTTGITSNSAVSGDSPVKNWGGVGIVDLTPEKARQLNLGEVHGVEIAQVAEDGPAEEAGLQRADVITRFRDEQVLGAEHLARLVRETPGGRTVPLEVWRDGRQREVDVVVQSRGLPTRLKTQIIIENMRGFPWDHLPTRPPNGIWKPISWWSVSAPPASPPLSPRMNWAPTP